MSSAEFFQQHTKLTRSLKKFIQDYEATLDESVFAAFLESLTQELENIKTDLFKAPAGPARARKLHALVEEEIEKGADIKINCQKGCSACCHMEVEITNNEADILAELIKNGHAIDRQKLQQQSAYSLQDKKWKESMNNQTNKCVFLNQEGACSIYESRPVMCRRHSVTSPAINCTDINAIVTLRYFPRVDLLISAANEDPQLQIGPLAKMLELRLATGI